MPEYSPDITPSGGSLLRAPFLSRPRFSREAAPSSRNSGLPPPLAPRWSHPPRTLPPTPSEPCHPPHAPPRRAFFNRFRVSWAERAGNRGFRCSTSPQPLAHAQVLARHRLDCERTPWWEAVGTLPQAWGGFGKVSGTLVLPPGGLIFFASKQARGVRGFGTNRRVSPFLQPLSGHSIYNLKLSPWVEKSAAASGPS